jgi:peptidoglycan/xylan/chitin deacetylase (PgdA/CDA1 family)
MIPETFLSRTPGHRRVIVSLCYDDGLPCHHEQVAPLLEQHGMRASFYPHLQSRVLEQAAEWKRVAAAGHEIGNHTIFHPCYDQKWLDRTYHLKHYTPQRWRDEVKVANAVLNLIDGCRRRTYGNTCHDNHLGEGEKMVAIETLAADLFVAARGEHTRRPVEMTNINWYNLGNKGIDGCGFADVRDEITSLANEGGWILYTMHSVGSRDHTLHIDEQQHRQLITWLAEQQHWIWTAPVRTVAETLRAITP